MLASRGKIQRLFASQEDFHTLCAASAKLGHYDGMKRYSRDLNDFQLAYNIRVRIRIYLQGHVLG